MKTYREVHMRFNVFFSWKLLNISLAISKGGKIAEALIEYFSNLK